jgi:hypothetical protein
MFILGIFIAVFLCVVGLRLFQCQHFWIIDSRFLTNYSIGWEGTLVFLLEVLSRLLGKGFYTTGSLESVRETFTDLIDLTREEHVHKIFMAKFIDDTNQGSPSQGDYCSFPFFGKVGVTSTATLNIPGLNVRLSTCLGTIPNVLNALDV